MPGLSLLFFKMAATDSWPTCLFRSFTYFQMQCGWDQHGEYGDWCG